MYWFFAYSQFGIDDWLRAHPVLLALLASASLFAIGYRDQIKSRSVRALAFQVMGLLILLSTAADTIHSHLVLPTILLILSFVLEAWLMRRRSRKVA